MSSIPICHATGETEKVDTKQHSSHRRILRDSTTRAARKNPERDPVAAGKKAEKKETVKKEKEKAGNKGKSITKTKNKDTGHKADMSGNEEDSKDGSVVGKEEEMSGVQEMPTIKTEHKRDMPSQYVSDNAFPGVTAQSEPGLGNGSWNAPSKSFAKYLTKDRLLFELDERISAIKEYQPNAPLPKLGSSWEELMGYYSILSTRISSSDLQSVILRQDILLLRTLIWGQLGTWKVKAWEKLHENQVPSIDRGHWFECLVGDIHSWATVQYQDAEFPPNSYLPPTALAWRNGETFKLKVGRIRMKGDPVKFAVDKAEEWVLKWTGLAQVGKEKNHALSALFISLIEQWLGPGVLSVYKVWKAAQSVGHWVLGKRAGQMATFGDVHIAVQEMQNEVMNDSEIADICTDLHNKAWEVRTEGEKERFLVFDHLLKSNVLTFKECPLVHSSLVSPGAVLEPTIEASSAQDPVLSSHPDDSLSSLNPPPANDSLSERRLDELVDQVYLCLQLTGDNLSHVANLPKPPPKSASESERRIHRFLSDVAQNANQRLPFRELGESRFHVLHAKENPYTPKNLRTASGFFSALMVRSIHHGTQFLLDHTPFYRDYEDWKKVYNKAQEEHPGDKKYFCDPAAYGQHCGPCRDPENAESYWASANNQEYNQWLLDPDRFGAQKNFLLSVVKVLSGKGFYGIGNLTAFQIAVDYMRAGAFEATLKEFAETLIWVNAGAVKGLVRLGYLKDKKGKQNANDVEVAFEQVLNKLRAKWDEKRGGKGTSIDMIDVEHWLCKTSPKRLGRSSYYAIYE
ncbi:hypothetical protein C8R42DRAFT_729205 [Lentinula raphanica]|nr:hypothetical protein C8R42DRAFT_729205 [Lentinula raphanica]